MMPVMRRAFKKANKMVDVTSGGWCDADFVDGVIVSEPSGLIRPRQILYDMVLPWPEVLLLWPLCTLFLRATMSIPQCRNNGEFRCSIDVAAS